MSPFLLAEQGPEQTMASWYELKKGGKGGKDQDFLPLWDVVGGEEDRRGRTKKVGSNLRTRLCLPSFISHPPPPLSLGFGTEQRRILIRRAGLEPRMSGKGGNWFGYRLVGRLLFSHLRTGSDDGSAKSSFLLPHRRRRPPKRICESNKIR